MLTGTDSRINMNGWEMDEVRTSAGSVNFCAAGFALYAILFCLIVPNQSLAETRNFIKEYSYQASEDDSRNSSRVIALREVKRLLLEELGTYLESETVVRNFQLTKDQITTLTAGIVQTEIAEEKWDGRTYWLRAKITADPAKLAESIDSLRKDRERTKELEDLKHKSAELLRDNERLRKELAQSGGADRAAKKAAYDRSVKELSAVDWIEKGFAAKSHEEASNAFSRAIELDPANIKAYYFRARSSEENAAKSDYYKILSIEPKDSEAHLIRAWTYKELKQRDPALKEFALAIEKASSNREKATAYSDRARYYGLLRPRPYLTRADDMANAGQLSVQDFSRAIELEPRQTSHYLGRAASYMAISRNDLALLDFNKVIEMEPNNAAAYGMRGDMLMFDRPDLALADYSKAIEMAPNMFDLSHRAHLYEQMGKKDLALKDYSRMIELYPSEYMYEIRARFYATEGKLDLAIQDYGSAIQCEPKYRPAYLERGALYTRQGKYGPAIRDFSKVIELSPDGGERAAAAYYNRALAYALKKDWKKAEQDLEKAVQIDPDYKAKARAESQKGFKILRSVPAFVKLIGD